MNVTCTINDNGLPQFLTGISKQFESRAAINKRLADTLSDTLKLHFVRKNALPNKMEAPKSGFWAQIAEATGVIRVDNEGGAVGIADRRFNLQYFGGTVKPLAARCLTIPIIPESRGLSVQDFILKTGMKPSEYKKATGKDAFAFVKSATIIADPEALPESGILATALTKEADACMRDLSQGKAL